MRLARRLTIVAALPLLASCAQIRPLVRYHDALSPDEHLQLGMSYEGQRLPNDAEREYRAAAGPHQRNVAGLLALGNLLYAEGRLKDADRALARAHRLSPGDKAVSNNLAMVYLSEKKNLKKAEDLAQSAAADARLRPYALDTLASVYLEEHRKDDARKAAEEARAAAPDDDPRFLAQLNATVDRISSNVP